MDIASHSMRIEETANRAGLYCVVIVSTNARFHHDEGTALRDGNGSLKNDLDRRRMQARGTQVSRKKIPSTVARDIERIWQEKGLVAWPRLTHEWKTF